MNKIPLRETMINQKAVRKILESTFRELEFKIFSQNEIGKLVELPDRFVVRNSTYITIYKQKGRSEFLVVDMVKNIKMRIEIKLQKTSGSVDEKFPYFYLNAATAHDADVLIILDGGGYKYGAKKWLENMIEEEWLLISEKKINIYNIVDGLKYIKETFK